MPLLALEAIKKFWWVALLALLMVTGYVQHKQNLSLRNEVATYKERVAEAQKKEAALQDAIDAQSKGVENLLAAANEEQKKATEKIRLKQLEIARIEKEYNQRIQELAAVPVPKTCPEAITWGAENAKNLLQGGWGE